MRLAIRALGLRALPATLVTLLAASAAADVGEINRAIGQQGARWTARRTPLTDLSLDEKRARLGVLPAPPPAGLPRFEPPLAARLAALPAWLDWRDHGGDFVTGIRNQDACGSCWAFAAVAALESTYLIEANLPGAELDLSEQDALSCSSSGTCLGGWPDGVLAFAAAVGLVDDECFAYVAADVPCSNKDAECPDWPTRTHRIHGYAWVENDVDAMRAALQQAPTTACFSVYEDFYSYGGGVYEHAWGGYVGEHAIELIGYDDAAGAWIAKNSWGEWWGEGGFFQLRYGDSNFGWCVYTIQQNRAPEFAPIYTHSAVPGQRLEFTVAAVDPDGDKVAYAMDAPPALAGATLDPATGLFSWTPPPGSQGVHAVLVHATDAWDPPDTATAEVLISVCDTPCDDDNPCTDDLCPGGACTHALNTRPCVEDGEPCTVDACRDGACYAPLPDHDPCPDDGSECTTEECRGGACQHDAVPDGQPCFDDYYPCTEDVCLRGACSHDAYPDGTPCDDWTACTTPDLCQDGWCVGKVPEDCVDGLDCTPDYCGDFGPHFRESRAPFAPLDASALDLGVEGDDVVAGPFPIGFDFVPPGDVAPRASFWVSSNGVLGFDLSTASWQGSCFPSPDEPNALVAPFWTDLVCRRDEGCTVVTGLVDGPPRARVVEWRGARPFGVKDAALDFQVWLGEDGGVRFHYGPFAGPEGNNAFVGLESGDGAFGAAIACGGMWLRRDMTFEFTMASTECLHWPEGPFCAIDGACWTDGMTNPDNACQVCAPHDWPFAWTSADGWGCDDGLICTAADSCDGGACRPGRLPPACEDGLDCTVDGCADVGFAAGGAPFADLGGDGVDAGLDGDGLVAGPFAIGFLFPNLDGKEREWFWVSEDGYLTFQEPWAPAGAYGCLPSPELPDDLVAPLLADLRCLASEGCSVRYRATGDELVVQWTGARLIATGEAATFQAALFPGGAVELRWAGAIDGGGATLAAGLEGPSGLTGVPALCGGPVAAGTLRWDPAAGCAHAVVPGLCAIGGACYRAGEPDPARPCRVCDPERDPRAWSPASGACDDGDPCTSGDACAAGACAGVPYACPGTDCLTSLGCDGRGGCVYAPRPAGVPCGEEPHCGAGGAFERADVCDGAGACHDGGAVPCWPYACVAGAGEAEGCATACATADGCAPGATCDADGACVPRRPDGEACAADDECHSGHCGGGICCAAGDCCADSSDCPDSYEVAPACDDPPRCQGHRGERACDLGHGCFTRWVEDDRGCTDAYRFGCAGEEQVCTGAADQPAETCLAPCDGPQDCPTGLDCLQGVCQPRPAPIDAAGAPTADAAFAADARPSSGDAGGGDCGCRVGRRGGAGDAGAGGPEVAALAALALALARVGARRRRQPG